ncbi:hypothetical protein ACFW3D_20660 [Streptomyces sp. NPDC058864]
MSSGLVIIPIGLSSLAVWQGGTGLHRAQARDGTPHQAPEVL